MRKIYSLWLRVVAWSAACTCPADDLPGLSARDWADLPTYHPAERQDGCLC